MADSSPDLLRDAGVGDGGMDQSGSVENPSIMLTSSLEPLSEGSHTDTEPNVTTSEDKSLVLAVNIESELAMANRATHSSDPKLASNDDEKANVSTNANNSQNDVKQLKILKPPKEFEDSNITSVADESMDTTVSAPSVDDVKIEVKSGEDSMPNTATQKCVEYGTTTNIVEPLVGVATRDVESSEIKDLGDEGIKEETKINRKELSKLEESPNTVAESIKNVENCTDITYVKEQVSSDVVESEITEVCDSSTVTKPEVPLETKSVESGDDKSSCNKNFELSAKTKEIEGQTEVDQVVSCSNVEKLSVLSTNNEELKLRVVETINSTSREIAKDVPSLEVLATMAGESLNNITAPAVTPPLTETEGKEKNTDTSNQDMKALQVPEAKLTTTTSEAVTFTREDHDPESEVTNTQLEQQQSPEAMNDKLTCSSEGVERICPTTQAKLEAPVDPRTKPEINDLPNDKSKSEENNGQSKYQEPVAESLFEKLETETSSNREPAIMPETNCNIVNKSSVQDSITVETKVLENKINDSAIIEIKLDNTETLNVSETDDKIEIPSPAIKETEPETINAAEVPNPATQEKLKKSEAVIYADSAKKLSGTETVNSVSDDTLEHRTTLVQQDLKAVPDKVVNECLINSSKEDISLIQSDSAQHESIPEKQSTIDITEEIPALSILPTLTEVDDTDQSNPKETQNNGTINSSVPAEESELNRTEISSAKQDEIKNVTEQSTLPQNLKTITSDSSSKSSDENQSFVSPIESQYIPTTPSTKTESHENDMVINLPTKSTDNKSSANDTSSTTSISMSKNPGTTAPKESKENSPILPASTSKPVQIMPKKSPHFNNAVIFVTSSNQQIRPPSKNSSISVVAKPEEVSEEEAKFTAALAEDQTNETNKCKTSQSAVKLEEIMEQSCQTESAPKVFNANSLPKVEETKDSGGTDTAGEDLSCVVDQDLAKSPEEVLTDISASVSHISTQLNETIKNVDKSSLIAENKSEAEVKSPEILTSTAKTSEISSGETVSKEVGKEDVVVLPSTKEVHQHSCDDTSKEYSTTSSQTSTDTGTLTTSLPISDDIQRFKKDVAGCKESPKVATSSSISTSTSEDCKTLQTDTSCQKTNDNKSSQEIEGLEEIASTSVVEKSAVEVAPLPSQQTKPRTSETESSAMTKCSEESTSLPSLMTAINISKEELPAVKSCTVEVTPSLLWNNKISAPKEESPAGEISTTEDDISPSLEAEMKTSGNESPVITNYAEEEAKSTSLDAEVNTVKEKLPVIDSCNVEVEAPSLENTTSNTEVVLPSANTSAEEVESTPSLKTEILSSEQNSPVVTKCSTDASPLPPLETDTNTSEVGAHAIEKCVEKVEPAPTLDTSYNTSKEKSLTEEKTKVETAPVDVLPSTALHTSVNNPEELHEEEKPAVEIAPSCSLKSEITTIEQESSPIPKSTVSALPSSLLETAINAIVDELPVVEKSPVVDEQSLETKLSNTKEELHATVKPAIRATTSPTLDTEIKTAGNIPPTVIKSVAEVLPSSSLKTAIITPEEKSPNNSVVEVVLTTETESNIPKEESTAEEIPIVTILSDHGSAAAKSAEEILPSLETSINVLKEGSPAVENSGIETTSSSSLLDSKINHSEEDSPEIKTTFEEVGTKPSLDTKDAHLQHGMLLETECAVEDEPSLQSEVDGSEESPTVQKSETVSSTTQSLALESESSPVLGIEIKDLDELGAVRKSETEENTPKDRLPTVENTDMGTLPLPSLVTKMNTTQQESRAEEKPDAKPLKTEMTNLKEESPAVNEPAAKAESEPLMETKTTTSEKESSIETKCVVKLPSSEIGLKDSDSETKTSEKELPATEILGSDICPSPLHESEIKTLKESFSVKNSSTAPRCEVEVPTSSETDKSTESIAIKQLKTVETSAVELLPSISLDIKVKNSEEISTAVEESTAKKTETATLEQESPAITKSAVKPLPSASLEIEIDIIKEEPTTIETRESKVAQCLEIEASDSEVSKNCVVDVGILTSLDAESITSEHVPSAGTNFSAVAATLSEESSSVQKTETKTNILEKVSHAAEKSAVETAHLPIMETKTDLSGKDSSREVGSTPTLDTNSTTSQQESFAETKCSPTAETSSSLETEIKDSKETPAVKKSEIVVNTSVEKTFALETTGVGITPSNSLETEMPTSEESRAAKNLATEIDAAVEESPTRENSALATLPSTALDIEMNSSGEGLPTVENLAGEVGPLLETEIITLNEESLTINKSCAEFGAQTTLETQITSSKQEPSGETKCDVGAANASSEVNDSEESQVVKTSKIETKTSKEESTAAENSDVKISPLTSPESETKTSEETCELKTSAIDFPSSPSLDNKLNKSQEESPVGEKSPVKVEPSFPLKTEIKVLEGESNEVQKTVVEVQPLLETGVITSEEVEKSTEEDGSSPSMEPKTNNSKELSATKQPEMEINSTEKESTAVESSTAETAPSSSLETKMNTSEKESPVAGKYVRKVSASMETENAKLGVENTQETQQETSTVSSSDKTPEYSQAIENPEEKDVYSSSLNTEMTASKEVTPKQIVQEVTTDLCKANEELEAEMIANSCELEMNISQFKSPAVDEPLEEVSSSSAVEIEGYSEKEQLPISSNSAVADVPSSSTLDIKTTKDSQLAHIEETANANLVAIKETTTAFLVQAATQIILAGVKIQEDVTECHPKTPFNSQEDSLATSEAEDGNDATIPLTDKSSLPIDNEPIQTLTEKIAFVQEKKMETNEPSEVTNGNDTIEKCDLKLDIVKLPPLYIEEESIDTNSTEIILPPPPEFSDDSNIIAKLALLDKDSSDSSNILRITTKTLSTDLEHDVISTPTCATPADSVTSTERKSSISTKNSTSKATTGEQKEQEVLKGVPETKADCK
ncbi:mucin-2-like [Stomoxys calcitrans]|uniref:mucin-2-like n=1 Tax=Stomoxys calcitrans TaxID=35570 RepID=UPI0027E23647|nr:mucin-2-like [Stomoxys calcitrans]